MNIVNVGYDSTNYYVINQTATRLLVDVGFPGTLGKLQSQCKRKGIPFEEIKYLLATHYHPDHAGLAQEVKQTGVELIILKSQQDSIPLLAKYLKPREGYVEITKTSNVYLTPGESRAFLKRLRLEGEIITTPGHSDDSVSLVLDTGAAFTGDLTPFTSATDESSKMVEASWQKIRALKANMIYPGHGPARPFR
jgi:glyoxylase-like metal-dependent hydrolase (beta-lactamase superfamily II)